MAIDDERFLHIEERTRDLVQEMATHSAVCIERQKMTLNTLASIEVRLDRVSDGVAKLSNDMHTRLDSIRHSTHKRLDMWLTAIAGAGILSTASLVFLIMTRGLK